MPRPWRLLGGCLLEKRVIVKLWRGQRSKNKKVSKAQEDARGAYATKARPALLFLSIHIHGMKALGLQTLRPLLLPAYLPCANRLLGWGRTRESIHGHERQ